MADWIYEAVVSKIYDGDTITVDLDMGMRIWQKGISIRLYGIDAPEITGETKEQGILSRDALRGILPIGSTVKIVSHQFEKYGRLLATVFYTDLNINNYMVENNFAIVRYY